MTVKDLIEKLSACPQEAIILLPYNHDSFVPLEHIDTNAAWKSDSDIFPFTYVTNVFDGSKDHQAGNGKMAVCLVPA